MTAHTARPFWFLFLLLALGLLVALPGALGPTAWAEEDEDEDEDGDDEPEPGTDLGEASVPFMERVNEAIEKGVIWLKAKPDLFEMGKKLEAAHWGLIHGARAYGNREGHEYQHPAGATALALYTLLKCGVDPKDDVIEKGFNWLKETHVATQKWDAVAPGFPSGHRWVHLTKCSSYELSAMILAVTAKYDKYKKTSSSKSAQKKGKLKIRDREDKEWLIEMVQALVERRGGPQPGELSDDEKRGWRYNVPALSITAGKQIFNMPGLNAPNANQDLSSTQLAALALFSADRFGIKVEPQIWLDILTFTLAHQEDTGPEHERFDKVFKDGGYAAPMDHARGFCYIEGSPEEHEAKTTGSMTACGLTNLLIAREVLEHSKKGKKLLDDSKIRGKIETGIWDSIAWLDLNWSPFQNKNGGSYHIYYLYALERAMDIMEKRLCGSHVWYEEGAKSILDQTQVHMTEVKIKKLTELMESFFWCTNATHDPKDVLDTCFALLFLKRATKGLVPGGVVTGS